MPTPIIQIRSGSPRTISSSPRHQEVVDGRTERRFMQWIGPPGTVTLWSRARWAIWSLPVLPTPTRRPTAALLNEMELGLSYGLPLTENGQLAESGIARPQMTLFKVFLNGSKVEQARRFVDRLKDKPRKIDLANIKGHPRV